MKSIKTRLVLIFSLVILIMMGGLGGVFITRVTADVTRDAHENLMEISKQVANLVQSRVSERLTFMGAVARNPILLDEGMSFEKKVEFFEAEAKRNGFLAIAFANKNGDATIYNAKRETTNIGSRDYFKKALSGEPAVSDLLISSATGELVLIYASPVYSNGEIVGVVYGRRDGNALSEIVRDISYKETGFAYMVNNQGVTVAHPDSETVLSQLNPIEIMKTDESYRELGEFTQGMISRTVGSGTYTLGGVKNILGYAPIEGTQWIVAVGVEESDALSRVRELTMILWIFVVIAVAVGTVITFVISSQIAKPIKRVTAAAQEIAQGKFDVSLTVKSKDEIGQLAEAFNLTVMQLVNYQGYIDELSKSLEKMAQGDLRISLNMEYVGQFQRLKNNLEALSYGLSDTLMQILQASEQVTAGSDQVAAGAQSLSQGATEQASSVEQLTAIIYNISEDLKRSTDNAHQARNMSAETEAEVVQSNKQMQQLMTAMEEISSTSNEIGKIVKTIDDIAFQTNILALNAAVEAARAGAAGKGFAVVADEVRNLAAKSAEAAKNTTTLIERTLGAIGNGGRLAGATAESLNIVVEKTKLADNRVQEITADIEKAATAVSQIAIGIDQISAVVQTNSATAEESAASSEQLSGQAKMLEQLISAFKMSETGAKESLDENISAPQNYTNNYGKY